MNNTSKTSRLVDLHCHILPCLDDGSKTPEMTYRMAETAVECGVKHIICTPHWTAGSHDAKKRILRIKKATSVLNYVFSEKNLPLTLYPGMELLCNEYLTQSLEKNEVLPLCGSRYLLIEFRFDAPLSQIEWAASEVQAHGYVPVLAHPERYPAVWSAPTCLSLWFYSGYILQLDKDSILGHFGSHCAHTAAWALRHGFAHVVASDAHDTRTRTTDLKPVFHHISKYFGHSYADLLLSQNPRRIIQNQEMVKP